VWLQLIELFYATRPQPSLAGYSPFFLDTGRSPRLPWDLVYLASPAEALAPGAEEMEQRLARLIRERGREGAQAAKYHPAPKFTVGDRVLLLRPPELSGSKMEFPYFGPFVVKECLERVRYRLADLHGRPLGKHDVISVKRLKRMPALSRDTIIDVGVQYEVEKIVAHRFRRARGCREFRLRYSDSPAEDTWEPASSLNGPALDMLDEYLAKHGLPPLAPDGLNAESSPATGRERFPARPAAAPATSDEAAEPPALDAVETAESEVKAARDARRERRAAIRQAALDAPNEARR
jgi:hypothetical protein